VEWLRRLFGKPAMVTSAEKSAMPTPARISQLMPEYRPGPLKYIAEAKPYAATDAFVAEVLSQYGRTGQVSPRQVAALARAIRTKGASPAVGNFVGVVGQEILVEGEIVSVPAAGSKKAAGNYVVYTDKGNVICPAGVPLPSVDSIVRFRAKVTRHKKSAAGYPDTFVTEARNIEVTGAPRKK
jgi:hypothetical protein